MARPSVSESAEEMFDALGPWSRADGEETGWALLHLCEATAGRLDPLRSIVMDDEDHPGWSSVLDVDRAPREWLPWLAQFVGVRLPAGLDEVAERARIRSTDGFNRGTPAAIKGAARQYLRGPDGTPDTATVFLTERHGSAYRLTVAVHASEMIASADVIYKAVLEQKPAGIVLNPISVVTGNDYLTLRDENASYTVVRGRYADYTDVETPETP